MDILTYIIITVISFLGILVGIWLSKIALEELQDVNKYLHWLNLILVPLMVIAVLHEFLLYGMIMALIIGILLYIDKERHELLVYAFSGIIFYVSSITDTILVVSVLIFIYGISIATFRHNRMNTKIILKHASFIIISLIAYGLMALIGNI